MKSVSWNTVKEFIPLATFAMGTIGFAITWQKFNQDVALNQKTDSELIYRHKQEINNLLLKEPNVATKLGLSKNTLLGLILVNDLEKIFVLRCKGLITNEQWDKVELMIHGQLNSKAHFRMKFWDMPIPELGDDIDNPTRSNNARTFSIYFSEEFQKYVKNLTDGEQPRKNEEEEFCRKITHHQ